MKRDAVILVVLGMVVLAIAAYSVISRPTPAATSSSNRVAAPVVQTTVRKAAGSTPSPSAKETKDVPASSSPTASSVDAPQRTPGEYLRMEPVVRPDSMPSPDEVVTQADECLFQQSSRKSPYWLAFLEKENLLLAINLSGVCALDVATGNAVWSRDVEPDSRRLAAVFGTRQVLTWTAQRTFLLDMATGQETWSWYNDKYGPIESARLSGDEKRIVVTCARAFILHSLGDQTFRVLHREPATRVCGWLSGAKTLVTVQARSEQDHSTKQFLLMDIDSGTMTPGWEPPPSSKGHMLSLSERGEVAESAGEGDVATVKIWDVQTGKLVRELKNDQNRIKHCFWLRDAKRLLCVTSDRREARIVDGETGAVQFTLSQEGQRFCRDLPFEDTGNHAWIFSEDEDNSRYVWPLIPEGTPRKVLDGSLVEPGFFRFCMSVPGCVTVGRTLEDKLYKQAVYTLQDMHRAAEWRIRERDTGWGGPNVNKNLTHYINFAPVGKDRWDHPQDLAFSVWAKDSETPVLTGRGRPLAVSPDAKYLAVQTDDRTADVYEVETKTVVGEFFVTEPERDWFYMKADFSDSGNRMVLNTTESVEVMELGESCPHWPLQFSENDSFRWGDMRLSPDGTRVLCNGSSRAGLFDADSGVLLRTFEEPERFTSQWAGRGFWGTVAGTAQDWAGMLSDRFKPNSYVEAIFASGGARVVTYASGQVIRVWDANSGQLLHTIHTELPEKRNSEGYMENRIALSANGRFAFCYNGNNFGGASLWSLEDGLLQRRYQLPGGERSWTQAQPADDGTAVYVISQGSLCRWPGVVTHGN